MKKLLRDTILCVILLVSILGTCAVLLGVFFLIVESAINFTPWLLIITIPLGMFIFGFALALAGHSIEKSDTIIQGVDKLVGMQ